MKFEDKKLICDLEEYYKKYHRRSNKCNLCGKYYKLPQSIFEPRDKICFSCEISEKSGEVSL